MLVKILSMTTHQEKQIHLSGPHTKVWEQDEMTRTIHCASQLNTFPPHNRSRTAKYIAIDKNKTNW